MSSCGSNSTDPGGNSVLGTYDLVTVDGSALPFGLITAGSLTLNVDNRCVASFSADDSGFENDGTYTIDGSSIAFVFDHGLIPFTGTLIESTVTVSDGFNTFVFRR